MSSNIQEVIRGKAQLPIVPGRSTTIDNCVGVKLPRQKVDALVDYAMEQGVAVRVFPDGKNPRGWYCKAVYTLGEQLFLRLISEAKEASKQRTGGIPSRLFSLLLTQNMNGRK